MSVINYGDSRQRRHEFFWWNIAVTVPHMNLELSLEATTRDKCSKNGLRRIISQLWNWKMRHPFACWSCVIHLLVKKNPSATLPGSVAPQMLGLFGATDCMGHLVWFPLPVGFSCPFCEYASYRCAIIGFVLSLSPCQCLFQLIHLLLPQLFLPH